MFKTKKFPKKSLPLYSQWNVIRLWYKDINPKIYNDPPIVQFLCLHILSTKKKKEAKILIPQYPPPFDYFAFDLHFPIPHFFAFPP